MRRLRSSHSYRFVLILILATFVFVMASPDKTWALSVLVLLLCGTLAMAIWTSGLGWRLPRTLGLITVGVVIAVATVTLTGNDVTGVDLALRFRVRCIDHRSDRARRGRSG